MKLLKESLNSNIDLVSLKDIDYYFILTKETKNYSGEVIGTDEYFYEDEQDALMHFENLKREMEEEGDDMSNLSLSKVNITKTTEEIEFFIPELKEDNDEDEELFDDTNNDELDDYIGD